MKFDKYKAFPYPVLRPDSDDYIDVKFEGDVTLSVQGNTVSAYFVFNNSCVEIANQVAIGNASYICVVSCRETYFQQVIKTQESKHKLEFEVGKLRGEVHFDSYIVVTNDIRDFVSPRINDEFGTGPFTFEVGDVLAQDETKVYFVDRDVFKSVTSVFDLVKKESLSDGLWTLNFDDDHILIEVGPKLKESIDNARNDKLNRVILMNSIYFSAVMQAVQMLQEPDHAYENRKWCKVFRKQAHNRGIELENKDAYFVAQRLMQLPARQLTDIVFKGNSR
jgi:hypothetical protein